MLFSTHVATALSLLLSVSAAPTPTPDTAAGGPQYPEFRLKTKLLRGAPARFANLYAQSYHIAAGESDITLNKNATSGERFFLNGTALQGDVGTTFPWSVVMSEATTYSGWENVQIFAGTPETQHGSFFANSTGLQWTAASTAPPHASNSNEESEDAIFGGWRVCDWSHGVPQLFWIVQPYHDPAPKGCGDVHLIQEFLAAQ